MSGVCGCLAPLINVWFRDGVELERRELGPDNGEADAREFLAAGGDEWVIACPQCDRVYAVQVVVDAG
jgi:hypothetical protein